MSSGGISVTPSSALLRKQSFTATEGQTDFTVTDFTVTSTFFVFVNDTKQGAIVRAGQLLTMPMGLPEGSLVEVYN